IMIAAPRQFLLDLYGSAVDAVSPRKCLPAFLPPRPSKGRTLVLGAGKGAAAMAKVVDDHRPGVEGLVITRYGHGAVCKHIEVVEASQPVPVEAGHRAAMRMLLMVQG